MGEVEAQLVRADIGAGLADVGAETLAQRGVQEMGRGVVALGRAPGRVIDAREHGLLGRSVPCSIETSSAWSSPSRKTSSTRAGNRHRRIRSRRRRRPDRRRRVERRLGELDQERRPQMPAHGADGGRLKLGLIAGEPRGEAGGTRARERAHGGSAPVVLAARGAGAAARARARCASISRSNSPARRCRVPARPAARA